MKILSSIGATLRGKTPPTAAAITDLIARAETASADANSRLMDLESRRQEMALADDADRRQYREALQTARDDVADSAAAIEALRSKHSAAVAAEAEAGRKSRFDAAKAVAGDLPKLVADYERQARVVRDTIRKIAEIDTALTGANADLPAGANPIPDSSNLRSVPAVGREVLSEKAVDLWCRVGSREPIAAEYQNTVSPGADGLGYSHPSGARHPIAHEKRKFIRRELREATTGMHPTPLGQLNLPAVRAGEPAIFAPLPGASLYSPGAIVEAVEAAVTAEKAPRLKAERPVVVEHVAQ